jgi:hypothetical protein
LFRFLAKLGHHNNRDWFDRNRNYYEVNVLGPIRTFTREIGSVLHLLHDELETDPKVGRTISRISNDLRVTGNKPPYRPFIYISFPKRGARWISDGILAIGFYGHGVAAGFYPGRRRPFCSGPAQAGIRNNLRLFQRYLDERRVASRYSELAGREEGLITRWPLPKSARRWLSMESSFVGEYFDYTDPVLYSVRFLDRVIEVLFDLYPLWLFGVSENIKHDLDLYRENRLLLAQPSSVASD